MRNIILLILLLISTLLLTVNKQPNKNTEVTISIPNLTYKDLLYLNNEFTKYPEMDYIEGSIQSNTITLKVSEQSFNQNKVENMLKKWDCIPEYFDYNNLVDLADFE